MTTAFLTEDFSFDPLDQMSVPNGASFYRCALPAWITQSLMGRPRFNMTDGFGIDDGQDGVFGFDTVVLKLFLDKNVYFQVGRAKAVGQRVIVDVDDFYPGLHDANWAKDFTDEARFPTRNRVWGEQITLAADTITVSTPFLYDYYAAKHPDVRLIRNGVDPAMFAAHQRAHSNRRPVIGWMGAVAWRSDDLEQMAGWMPGFMARHRLQFHHGGHMPGMDFAADRIGIPRPGTSVAQMVPIHRLGTLMDFDIGIVPLNDVPFNRGKSGLKGLEYAACGIPFIASDIPEYQLLAADGIGVVAASDEEWTEHATRLLDRRARVEAAAWATEAVLGRHTIAHRIPEWTDAINVPRESKLIVQSEESRG